MNNKYSKKLAQLVKSSIRIQLFLAFIICILFSLLVAFVSSPILEFKERKLDYTEGIVTIDDSARELVKQFHQMNLDINGLVKELGIEDPEFNKTFLNRRLPTTVAANDRIKVPVDENLAYHLSKQELIQFLLNKQQNKLEIVVTNTDGKILYKSKGVTKTEVNLKTEMANAKTVFFGKQRNEHPKITRLYPITLNGDKNYVIVSGYPKATVFYETEPGVTPYLLGTLTFILCFYFITKRKMTEIEEIALGLKEIAKGNLRYRIREKSQDELGSLATNINYMTSELHEMIERDRQSEKLKDELITNVSHDLRTPLTSIMGYLRLVKDRQYKNQSQLDEYVDIAYGKSEQLKKLIEDLFDFTRLNYEGVQLKKERVSLNQLLRQLMEELDPIAQDHNVKFISELPKDHILMEVDPNQMVRALENVLSNAIKYSTPPGNIYVKMIKEGSNVKISISNPCETLSEDEVARLFDRFYRVDTSRSSNKSGAGLGLAITKSIIDLHNGSTCVSYDDQVIQFSIVLPINP
ncbi:sensor histidine kinase [Bacillus sp. JJ1764]|uniref:sensor histidine kinase n=1 Tax=Bacillus sp. JJ1764 TaxID=3122964 RepID=UPI002FFEF7FF